MYALGLSGYFGGEAMALPPNLQNVFYHDAFHDAAACITLDGELVAAVEEERLNRTKKTTDFPVGAIRACLDTAGISASEVGAIGYSFGEEFLDASLAAIYRANPELERRTARDAIRFNMLSGLGWDAAQVPISFAQHHLAHALSVYHRSGMDEALVVVMDGRGERHSTTVYKAKSGRLESLATYGLGQSLGGLYLSNTRLLGYSFGDEYKIMGLAPYGDPDVFRETYNGIYKLQPGGQFALRQFVPSGLRRRQPGERLTQRHRDIAASLQEALERIAMHVILHWSQATESTNLCFSGGVAHNSTLNGRILSANVFEQVFVHPAANDAGAAEGAALAAYPQIESEWRRRPRMTSAFVGPPLGSSSDIERELCLWSAQAEYSRPKDTTEEAAQLLAEGAVIGWARGRSEFGPRALGNRSILADARPAENRDRINAVIKNRESYRPFAPAVLAEKSADFFSIPATEADLEFMSFVVPVRDAMRSLLGAVTHIDGTARVQLVHKTVSPHFYALLECFSHLTGVPVLLNTSFNNRHEPIVQTVRDAVTCFLTTKLDVLILGDYLVRRRHDGSNWGGLAPILSSGVVMFEEMQPGGSAKQVGLQTRDGRRTTISPALFDLLQRANGVETFGALRLHYSATEPVEAELQQLWERRLVLLQPVG